MCSFTTGYSQNETLSCLIDYDLQKSGRVKALPFGCCAALTRPDPADMIQTSRQSLSTAQTLSQFPIGCDFHGIRDKAGPVTVERS